MIILGKGVYYVYLYKNPSNNSPIYVGKGQRKRAYYYEGHNIFLKNTIKKYGKPIIEFVAECVSQSAAFALEKKLIAQIGRKDLGLGPLCNLTNGGEGISGHKRSEEFKQTMRNRVISEETRKKISETAKGKKMSIEARKKMSENAKKRKFSKETRIKIGIKSKERIRSELTKQRVAKSVKNSWIKRKLFVVPLYQKGGLMC